MKKNTKLNKHFSLNLGANYIEKTKVSFKVWAPNCSEVKVNTINKQSSKLFPMEKECNGYFYTEIDGIKKQTNYFYFLDNKKKRPDPVSRLLPKGPHGPTAIINNHAFKWSDKSWRGIKLEDYIIYELHTGTFTKEGTFNSIIKKIPYLKQLGISCIEIMPVSQFPGKNNWGYDGVSLYSVQNSYGGPEEFKKLINACHKNNIAVCLDIVYNHFGPEGNYLSDFGPYFTDKYHTPWGSAINFDGRDSDHVREFIINNALYWINEFHIDALRLDAIHEIYDSRAKNILESLHEAVELHANKLKRKVYLIAESDLNDTKIITSIKNKGYGLNAQWSDDFHHSIHSRLTGENNGCYQDFSKISDIVKALKDGFIFDGKYSNFRKRIHGNSAANISGEKLVVYTQNHDQIGNRAIGDRISTSISFEKEKLAASLLLLSPYIPLLFMGQEYGEIAPFLYFIDHSDKKLVKAVQEGRKREFFNFKWKSVPDPNSQKTFNDSKLHWDLVQIKKHKLLLNLYTDLISFRKKKLLPKMYNKKNFNIYYSEKNEWIAIKYKNLRSSDIGIVYSFSDKTQTINMPFKKIKGFSEILNTNHLKYGGLAKNLKTIYKNEILLSANSAIIGQIVAL